MADEQTIAPGRGPETVRHHPMRRLHKLMLLLAFEVLVFGFTQSQLSQPRRGITVETTVTPNHVVT